MRPQRVQVSSVTASNPIPLDRGQDPFTVGFAVTLGAGVMTYTVEHTYDDVISGDFGANGVNATWFPHSAALTAATTNKEGNYASPICAVRLNVSAWTSGTGTLTILNSSNS